MKKRLIIFSIITLVSLNFCCKDDREDVKIISGPDVVYFADSSQIEIVWETDHPSKSIVKYGLTEELLLDTLLDEECELHQVPMYYLEADTLFYFKVQSKSDYFDKTPESDIYSFRTDRWRQVFSPEIYTEKGWDAWKNDEFEVAHGFFQQALNVRPYFGPALTGLGWTLLYFDDQLEDAYATFNDAIARYDDEWDAYAGRAFVYTQRQQYSKVMEDILSILEQDDEYISDNIPDIVYEESLRSLLANAYYNKGFFDEALAQCDSLKSDHGLDRNNSATWTVNAQQFDSFLEALLALINSLMTEYGLI